MFGGDFVFSVTRDFVSRCRIPLLLQPGTDKAHPAAISEEIARLAPDLEVQKDWRAPAHLAESAAGSPPPRLTGKCSACCPSTRGTRTGSRSRCRTAGP